jgi:mono/diheme cytochrome c family protein
MNRNWNLFLLAVALAGMIRAAESPEKTPDGILAFDQDAKETTVPAGEPAARFAFNVANISGAPVTINAATASCGCTVAKLPAQPWVLMPGAHGEISVTMNVAGESGELVKFVYVNTTQGLKMLTVKTTILPSPEPMRDANRKIAKVDRQAVFKGDCARCHAAPATGLHGRALYAQVCGICHDASHRASMVPDLLALNRPSDRAFWRQAITDGRPSTLMPAFAAAQGGPLTDEQIKSLATYLAERTPPSTQPQPQIQQ